MSKKARLGRGLDALLGQSNIPSSQSKPRLVDLPISKLNPGRHQPRLQIDSESIAELAQSIKKQGVVQPILVRAIDDDNYEIIAGERRMRAATLAGLTMVPAIIRNITDNDAFVVALIENIQRQDLNPIEEAAGLQRLLDEFKMTHQQVAENIGRSRSAVSNQLRLLALAPEVKEFLQEGQLDMGHGRALLTLAHDQQAAVAKLVVQRNMSVRATEKWVQTLVKTKKSRWNDNNKPDADIAKLEAELSIWLCAKVRVNDKSGKGRISIEYHSLDELDGILAKLKK